MFRTHPDFAHWRLRTDVEWRGRARPLVARLASWPDSDAAILVCNFEDEADAGDWAVKVNRSLYPLLSPQQPGKLLERVHVFDALTRQPRIAFRPRAQQMRRLCDLLGTLWRERQIVRLFALPALPAEPRVVSEGEDGLRWNDHDVLEECTAFCLGSRNEPFALGTEEMNARLQSQWRQSESDARFAWNWSALQYAQRWGVLFGAADLHDNLSRVMQLVLLSCERLWQSDEPPHWRWDLNVRSGYSIFSSFARHPPRTADIAQKWGAFLSRYCQAHFREDLVERHQCARDFINQKHLPPIVQGAQRPTAHQQLEAQLQLRDWLRDKATPAEAAALLATLRGNL